MSADSKRDWRKRVYALMTLGLVCIVGLVGMGSMLARGHDIMNRKVYKFPLKTLIALSKAQSRFRRKDLDGDGKPNYASSLEELEEAGTITKALGEGRVGDYDYRILEANAGSYRIVATPAEVTSQSVFYFVDQTRVIRASPGSPADGTSEVFWSPYNAGWGQ